MPHASGLPRNIAQCLEDFNIPLYLNHITTKISGKDRVEAIEIAPHKNGVADMSRSLEIACDTVLLSVGLVPENELSVKAGIKINPDTGGPIVNSAMMTSVPAIFACGNVLHVHDLVDFVSEEAIVTARAVIDYLSNRRATLQNEKQTTDKPTPSSNRRQERDLCAADKLPGDSCEIKVIPGINVKYTVPNSYNQTVNNGFYLRSMLTRFPQGKKKIVVRQ